MLVKAIIASTLNTTVELLLSSELDTILHLTNKTKLILMHFSFTYLFWFGNQNEHIQNCILQKRQNCLTQINCSQKNKRIEIFMGLT